MQYYPKRILFLGNGLSVTPEGLGYRSWLIAHDRRGLTYLNSAVATGGRFDTGPSRPGHPGFMFQVHPFVRATAQHAEALGVEVGQPIAGIRWIEDNDEDGWVPWDSHLKDLDEEQADPADRGREVF